MTAASAADVSRNSKNKEVLLPLVEERMFTGSKGAIGLLNNVESMRIDLKNVVARPGFLCTFFVKLLTVGRGSSSPVVRRTIVFRGS